MADKIMKTLNGYEVYDEYARTQLDSKFDKTGGTVTGATTFNSTVKIGDATLSYDTTEDALVISFSQQVVMLYGNIYLY